MTPSATRLLLVDDDPLAIRTLSRMLAQYPDQRFATSGAEALRLARELTPDLILLDEDMPGMTGLQVCEALKADAALAHVPVIFATSQSARQLEAVALGRGAVDFVNKPLVAAQVVARVRARLRPRRTLDKVRRESGGKRTPRMLIVDDDDSALRLMHHTLTALGEIHYAKRGDDALRVARRLAPDLIVLDIRMPGLDGLEVCDALKSEMAFQHVPVVLVTRFSDAETERRAFEVGAADFIAKPFAPAVLQARVRNLLDIKRRLDAELQSAQDHWQRIGDTRIADFVSTSSDAIISYDELGLVVLANAAAGRLFAAPPERLLGRSVPSLLGAGFPPAAEAPGEPLRLTLQREHAAEIAVEASLSSVGVGASRLVTVVLRDAGDREGIAQRQRVQTESKAADRVKSQMLAGIAHEMGNPLNAVLVFAQLMATDKAHELPPEQARRLEKILASGQTLRELLRDVVDLGQINSGALTIEAGAVDPDRYARLAVEALAPMAARAGVAISQAPSPQPALCMIADGLRLRQCLDNLLSNAIKYNQPGGRIDIEIQAHNEQVAIAVRDTGIGMNAQQLTQLFEPFNRLGRRSTDVPGTGLGLWITRQLVHAMAGKLLVESKVDQGSCFTVLLPRCPPPAPAQESAVKTENS